MAEKEQAHNGQRDDGGAEESGIGGNVMRAAVIAAASGAGAIAARKAMSERQKPRGGGGTESSSSGGQDLLSTVFKSGWDSASDTVLPFVADAATRVGEYVGRAAPELLRETLVPRFIDGFERGRSGDS